MMYVDFNAGMKEYKLRLNTRNIISLEKQLDCNPLMIFGNGDTMPTLTVMVSVLHASLQQYQHGITMADAYNIFDEWLDDGHLMTDFLEVIVDIYRVSGLLKNVEVDGEKN
jgi:hypothetical protein